MKHQIKHRYTNVVLFECDVPDDVGSGLQTRHSLEEATKERANLTGANLAGANLTGAYLTGANLTRANLAGANLTGSTWRGGVTLGRAPLQLSGLYWMVYILDDHMQIGCELHTLQEWAEFDDERIVQMDGRNALRFWRSHKDALLALAESDGRGVKTEQEME